MAVEFVAYDDFDQLGGDDSRADRMDIKGVAASVAGQVKQHEPGVVFGAFYDPVSYYGQTAPWLQDREPNAKKYAGSEPEARAQSRRLLRQQVKDFVDWLKGQGVI
ncbi:MAG: hypothetical protein KJ749_04860 [Planctomycetes bacterium]|nr:hypothetical protein [Planctomycetota bacterium]